MRVTIVVDDNIVIVDGKARTVDCAPLIGAGLHAMQWYASWGEEEYRSEIDPKTRTLTRRPNAVIDDLSPYQSYVDAWNVENAKQSLIEAAQQKEMDDNAKVAAKDRRRVEATMQLPMHVQAQLMEQQQEKMQAQAERAEKQRLEAWDKMSPDEQRRLIDVVTKDA